MLQTKPFNRKQPTAHYLEPLILTLLYFYFAMEFGFAKLVGLMPMPLQASLPPA